MRPKILITNDDGIHAPGLMFLYEALTELAEVTIVAPSDEKSASGLSITIRHPLHVQQVKWKNNAEAWSVTGTPADCIKLALSQYMITPPDLVVSGINPGSNAGRNVLYSGTVGGTIEAIMHEIPGVAFSTLAEYDYNFSSCVPYIQTIVEHVLNDPLPLGTLLNVNFPEGEKFRGLKFTRQGGGMCVENPDKRIHPTAGHTYYWIGRKDLKSEEPEDTDTWWLEQNYITAVPVHVAELTDHRLLQKRKESFEELFKQSDSMPDDEFSCEKA